MFMAETWLKDSNNFQTGIFKECSNLTFYNVIRDSNTWGGGVGILIKSDLDSIMIKVPNYESFEVIVVSVRGGSNTINLVGIYRRDIVSMSLFLDEFSQFITFLFSRSHPFLICGDFNIRWNLPESTKTSQFCDIIKEYGLHPFAPESRTHIKGNTLDFILADELASPLIDGISVDLLSDPTVSDHHPLTFNFLFTRNDSSKPLLNTAKRNFKSVDTDIFKMDISTSLNKSFNDTSLQSFADLYQNYSSCVSKCVEDHAPLVLSKTSHAKRPQWMDHEFVVARALRRKLERRYKKTLLPNDKLAYNLQRDLCCHLANSKRQSYYQEAIASKAGDQRALFSFVNKLLDNEKSSLLPNHSNPFDLSNSFNTFFIEKVDGIRNTIVNCMEPLSSVSLDHAHSNVSINTVDNNNNNHNNYNSDSNNNILGGNHIITNNVSSYNTPCSSKSHVMHEFEPCTAEEVTEIIKSANLKTSPSDPLPTQLLKECVDEVIPYLTVMINCSLKTGSIDGIKEAIVRPYLKKAGLDHNEYKNYRPISNLAFVSKILERIVLKRLNSHMDAHNLHCDTQFGYKKGHSTETLLLHFYNNLLVAVDQRLGVVVLLIDLSAAFDTVDHNKLLQILFNEIGISGTALQWFKSFLTGRSQRVVVGDSFSDPLTLKFGVPQGSVLGPVLFNIYTRSISNVFSKCGFTSSGYADDNSGSCVFTSQFQYDVLISLIPVLLSNIKSWMDYHFLKLNEDKTQIIVFGNPYFRQSLSIHGLFTHTGNCIRFDDHVKYLGVCLDNSLNFNLHINNITSSCYMFIRKIASIRKYISQSNCETLVHAFITSRLDMCNVLYFGMSEKNINKLQKIQNAAIRVIFSLKKRDHVSDLLHSLHWLSVRQRISFKVLIIIFKSIHRVAPVPLRNLISIKNRITLQLEVNTFFPSSVLGKRAFSFFAPRQWNALPVALRTIQCVDTFKAKLKHHLFNNFDDFSRSYNKYNT